MRALALALLLALPAGAAGAGARQVAFVEEDAVHALEGVLGAEGPQAFRFPVREENVTRVAFHLNWDPGARARVSLAVQDPSGRDVALPVSGEGGELRLASGPVAPVPAAFSVDPEGLADALDGAASRAGVGEWRVLVETEEPGEPVAYTLEVEATRYRAVVLGVVTLKGAGTGSAMAWKVAAPAFAVPVLALGAALACSRKHAHSVVPPGDTAPSPTVEQGECASER